MKTTPLISIITPAYNAARFLPTTVASVAKQTFSDVEMIIVDDNSSDNTPELMSQLMAKHSFIRYFRNSRNKGPAFCRNLAIRKARGEYIAFLDSDDLWFPQKLEKQINFMRQKSLDFSYTAYCGIDERGTTVKNQVVGTQDLSYSKLLFSCPIGCLTVMYRKKAFPPIYMPNIPRGQDYGFWLKLNRLTDKTGYINEVLAFYRDASGSISSSKIKKTKNLFDMFTKHLKYNPLLSSLFVISHILRITFRRKTLLPKKGLQPYQYMLNSINITEIRRQPPQPFASPSQERIPLKNVKY